MKPHEPTPTISDLLRDALRETTETIRGVSRATGVPHTSLIRFLRGELRLRLDMAERLVEHFGIEVRRPTGGKRKG